MQEKQGTQIGRMTVRKQRMDAAGEPHIEWKQMERKRPGERLLGNSFVPMTTELIWEIYRELYK